MNHRIFLSLAALVAVAVPSLGSQAYAATSSSSLTLGRTGAEVTHEWFPVSFEGSYSVRPLFFGSIQTTNGGDPVALRYRNLSTSGVEVFAEEEQSKDTETEHAPEQVGYLTMDHPGYIQNENSGVIGEAGWLTIDQKNKSTWYKVGLRGTYNNPVVLAITPSFNGGHPTTMRLRNVGKTSFEVQIDEWNYLDGNHTVENIDYIVLEAGRHTLADGTAVEAGTLTTKSLQWSTMNFTSSFDNTPVVLGQSQTYAGGDAVVARLKDITSTNFTIRLQEEERLDSGAHLDETVGYMAFSNDSLTEEPPVEETNATLFIEQQALVSTDVIVRNEEDVNMLRFEATASEASILLTAVRVAAQKGTAGADATNYTLWVDIDGDQKVDTIVGDSANAENDIVTFSDLFTGGVVLPVDTTIAFEVHADIASSPLNSYFQLALAPASVSSETIKAETLDTGVSLEGVEVDSVCTVAVCQIIVERQDSTDFDIARAGNLFVSKDATPVRARQLLGGTLGDTVLRVQLRADYEDIDVTDIQLSVLGDDNSIDRLELYTKDGTLITHATRGGCGSDDVPAQTFCANIDDRHLIVEEGQDKDILVRPRIKSNTLGGTSGDTFTVYISGEATANGGTVRARGATSRNDLTLNNEDTNYSEGEVFMGNNEWGFENTDVTGNEHTVVMSKISAIANASPDANGATVPLGVSPIGQFAFTAASNSNYNYGPSNVRMSAMIFAVDATNVELAADSFIFNNKKSSVDSVNCKAIDAQSGLPLVSATVTGLFNVLCTQFNTAVDVVIESGKTETFVLSANVINANTSATGETSVLQVSLTDFTDSTKTYNGQEGFNKVVWVDIDTAGSTQFTWIEYPETTINSTLYRG